ncbi:MAG TPA: sulfotransferase [Caulobacterales bacterium]|nr:sulfotransferase [Caulobacterales bacterium]
MPPSPSVDAIIDASGSNLDPVILQGLLRLSESLKSQKYDEGVIGREVLRALTVACQIAEERARGSIAAVNIEAPVLITGFGRTGSTYLHNLMSCDRALRAPNLWELWRPTPAPTPQHRDFRISLAHAQLRQWSKAQLQLHPMHPERPDECYWIIPHQHCHALAYNAETYCQWMGALSDDEMRRIYECYRDYARLLMRNFPGRRWLGKCLAHMHYIPVLHQVFPGAKLIRLHRDPREAVLSYCALLGAFTKAMLPDRDPFQSRNLVVEAFAEGASRMLHCHASTDCVDILYDDLVSSPIETIMHIYEKLGLAYSDEFHRALARAAALPASPRRAPLQLTDVGLSEGKIRSAMPGYFSWAATKWGARIWGGG